GDDTERADTATALESVKGLLRSEVGRQTGVRFTPTLAFVADALPDNARQIEDLLRRARESDAELARGAAGAQYAGDPDPYRVPVTEDEAAEMEAAGAETAGAETAGAETAGAETAGAETGGAAAADDLQDGRPA
ncbi:MAG TPA: ribosome-binding factor A, partial [Jiangellales bacterium]|nr:ribosome-binding factor A [Jiangellales bacterium]